MSRSMFKQDPVTLTPGLSPRIMASEILPVIMEGADITHRHFWGQRPIPDDVVVIQRYVRDFQTIRLNMGMRSGHTYAVSQLAKKDDLVIVLRNQDHGYEYVNNPDRITVKELPTTAAPGKYNTIWLEDFSLWPRTPMGKIREKFITRINQRIIVLG